MVCCRRRARPLTDAGASQEPQVRAAFPMQVFLCDTPHSAAGIHQRHAQAQCAMAIETPLAMDVPTHSQQADSEV